MKYALCLAAALLAASGAFAQTTIDQNKALAGSITPGDTPGFPVTISQSGSYKLMSNLTVPAGSNGIVISADNVSIDFNGFTLSGPVDCTGLGAHVTCTGTIGEGVTGTSNVTNRGGTTLRNGTVTGFGSTGIRVGREALLQNMRVHGNGGNGLFVVHAAAVIDGGVYSFNGGNGISVMSGASLIRNVTASSNRVFGVYSQSPSSMTQGAVVFNNGQHGINGGAVSGSVMSSNTGAALWGTHSMGNNLCNNVAC